MNDSFIVKKSLGSVMEPVKRLPLEHGKDDKRVNHGIIEEELSKFWSLDLVKESKGDACSLLSNPLLTLINNLGKKHASHN